MLVCVAIRFRQGQHNHRAGRQPGCSIWSRLGERIIERASPSAVGPVVPYLAPRRHVPGIFIAPPTAPFVDALFFGADRDNASLDQGVLDAITNLS